jgi:8-oxo-dGTP pyrophosphatase MutT (NUDIX family)
MDKVICHWKIITGSLDTPGEDVSTCAIREVQEETGVEASFSAVLAVRHLHNFRFGKSDIHFLCVLKPENKTINFDPNEISECRWVKFDEYVSMEGLSVFQVAVRDRIQDYLKDPSKCLKMSVVSSGPKFPAIMYYL